MTTSIPAAACTACAALPAHACTHALQLYGKAQPVLSHLAGNSSEPRPCIQLSSILLSCTVPLTAPQALSFWVHAMLLP